MLQEVSNKAPANLQTLAQAVHSLQGGYNLNCSWVIHTHKQKTHAVQECTDTIYL